MYDDEASGFSGRQSAFEGSRHCVWRWDIVFCYVPDMTRGRQSGCTCAVHARLLLMIKCVSLGGTK